MGEWKFKFFQDLYVIFFLCISLHEEWYKTFHTQNRTFCKQIISVFFNYIIWIFLFFSGTSQVVIHLWTCTTATGWAKNTIGNCDRRVCNALWDQLVEEQLPFPTEESWRAISEGFKNTAHFPNCIGSVDGKHVRVLKYPGSGSMNLKYKFFLRSSYGRGRFKLSLCMHRCRSIRQGL